MQIPVGRRSLLADRAKFILAVGGVALAIVLILVIISLYEGVRRETSSFIQAMPGDIWVTQEGTTDLVFSNSHLPESVVADAAAVDGVIGVDRLYGRLMSFAVDGENVRSFVMALSPDESLNRPSLQEFMPKPGTIILDSTFATQAGLSEGDALAFAGEELIVAEARHVGNVLVAQFSFVSAEDFARLFGIPGSVNFLLVSTADDATGPAVTSLAEEIPGSSVYSTGDFAGLASEKGTGDFLPIIRVEVAISFIVGISILSLVVYSATIERAREYAIMKVLGASPLRLYRIVLGQSSIIAAFGFGIGIGLTFLVNRVAGDLVPQFVTYIRWQDILFVFIFAAVMTFVSSFLPLHRIARVEPAAVFRA